MRGRCKRERDSRRCAVRVPRLPLRAHPAIVPGLGAAQGRCGRSVRSKSSCTRTRVTGRLPYWRDFKWGPGLCCFLFLSRPHLAWRTRIRLGHWPRALPSPFF